ncbi:MAG: hypothetical protein ACT4OJ_04630 [Bacteroidota bacterium]
MRKARFFLIAALCMALSKGLTAQTAAEKRDYLQKNIRIWVLMQPNVDTPSFYSVKPTGVFLDTDGIIMGKKSNNMMDNSAKLLSALFKDGSKSANGGDQPLQDNIYALLAAIKKPVEIFFINDLTEYLDKKYAAQYGYYFTEYAGDANRIRLEDAVFKAKDPAISAGSIVLSAEAIETSEMNFYKGELVYLMAKLFLEDYSVTTHWFTNDIPNKNPPARMYALDPLIISRVHHDSRMILKDAAAYSFSLHKMGNPGEEKIRELYKWLENGATFITMVNPPPNQNPKIDIPANMIVNNRIRQSFVPGGDTGFAPTNPPFENDEANLKKFKLYCMNFFPTKLVMQNNFVLALYFEMIMNKTDIKDCINSFTLGNNRFMNAKPEEQLAVLIENLCAKKRVETLTESLRDTSFFTSSLFPLALLDVFLEFPMEGNLPANLSKFDETFYGVFPAGSFSKDLLKEYFKIRPQLYEAAMKGNSKKAIGIRNTGYDNFQKVINAVYDFFIING